MRYGFTRPGGTHLKMRLLAIAALASSGLHLYCLATLHVRKDFAASAFALYLLALALFLWSALTIRGRNFALAYSTSSPRAVVENGPYQWIRHPLYLAYSTTWIAGAIACRSFMLLGTVVVMAFLYTDAARQEENEFLCGALRREYLAYKSKVGIIGPKVGHRRLRKREA